MPTNRVAVKVHGKENLEKALSIFKNKVQRAGILEEYKERQFYTKPSEARREKRKQARRQAKT